MKNHNNVAEQWKTTEKVKFFAKNHNFPNLRRVGFGNLENPVIFSSLMEAVGVTPLELEEVFKKEKKRGSNFFFFKTKFPRSFEDLGSFPLQPERFVALAKILGKTIEVIREDGMYSEHYPLFTVHPSGEVIFAKKK